MGRYGLHLGMAFQIVDDVLDYQGSSHSFGKNIGNDLAEGKTTLPLIYALKKASKAQAQQIHQAIEHGSSDQLALIQEIIVSTGAIEETLQLAKKEIQLAKDALAPLPASIYRDAMAELATFAVSRG